MSVTQVGKLFTAPIVHALSLQVLGKATFKEARSSGQQQVLGFAVRCFPTLLSFEAFPNNRTQRSQRGSQHARPRSPAPPRGSPSPTWVENPQRVSQQPEQRWSGQLRLTRLVIPTKAGALPRAHLHLRRALVATASAVQSLCAARSQPPAAP